MRSWRFKKEQHVRATGDFKLVFDGQQRASDRFLLVFGLRNDAGLTRIGLSVSKKHGNAVRRARLKRLLREAFRLTQYDVPAGWDFVLIPRADAGATLKDFQASLVKLTRQIARRTPPAPETPRPSPS